MSLLRNGNAVDAATLAEQLTAEIVREHGSDSREAATCQHALAAASLAMGDYQRALPLFREARDLRTNVLGPDHSDTAATTNDLAVAYMHIGDFQEASRLLDEAVRVRRQTLGDAHRETIESLMNVAAIEAQRAAEASDAQVRAHHYAEALRILEQCIRSMDEAPDHDGLLLATAHNNIAVIYRRQGGHGDQVLHHLEQAMDISAQHLGEKHPLVATHLDQLAGEYWARGDTGPARKRFERALALRDETLGNEHFETALSANRLAAFYQSTGRYKDALDLYKRGLAMEDATFANVFTVAPEEQKLALVRRSSGHSMAALSLIQRHFQDDDAATRFALEIVLRRKGIVQDAQAQTQAAMRRRLSPEARATWDRLAGHVSELSPLLLQTPTHRDTHTAQRVEHLRTAIAREQRLLQNQSGLAARAFTQRKITVQALAAALPNDHVLVEYVRVRDWNERRAAWGPTLRYLAFVLNRAGKVTLVDLGYAQGIDEQIRLTRLAIHGFLGLPSPHDPTFPQKLAVHIATQDAALATLHTILMRPLADAIGEHNVIISPDGELSRVPFAALRTADDRYVVETRRLSYVASGRDLARGRGSLVPTHDLALVANPAFDAASPRASQSRPPLFAHRWESLPGTAREAARIRELAPGTPTVLLEGRATESAVRDIRSPKILHLATHGFFLAQATGDESPPGESHRDGTTLAIDAAARSGLILAGANTGGLGPTDDGILFATEITSMDLHGTELVVLSACDTGLGVQTGDGIFGLRRAFVLAGASHLVMSLWLVDDTTTSDLMTAFYEAYTAGQSIPRAFHAAQVRTLAQLREKYEAAGGTAVAPVILWAPFIVQRSGL